MIRAVVVMGILVLTTACSQVGDHPTPTPTLVPSPNGLNPISPSTINDALADLAFACDVGVRGTGDEAVRLELRFDNGFYYGTFPFSMPASSTRAVIQDMDAPQLACVPVDTATGGIWDRASLVMSSMYLHCEVGSVMDETLSEYPAILGWEGPTHRLFAGFFHLSSDHLNRAARTLGRIERMDAVCLPVDVATDTTIGPGG